MVWCDRTGDVTRSRCTASPCASVVRAAPQRVRQTTCMHPDGNSSFAGCTADCAPPNGPKAQTVLEYCTKVVYIKRSQPPARAHKIKKSFQKTVAALTSCLSAQGANSTIVALQIHFPSPKPSLTENQLKAAAFVLFLFGCGLLFSRKGWGWGASSRQGFGL